MCGIFGILHRRTDTTPDPARVEATLRLLSHRGPDACGAHLQPGVALAHTRLSLLDPSARGNQPFWDEDCQFALVYNGEIYNFRELRGELEREGVCFRTDCDTEVLLRWLIVRGVDATLPRLEGMFAFGLWDRRNESLTLARDRFGMKPLFVFDDGDTFAFASETRAFRPWLHPRPDRFALSAYLIGTSGPTLGHTFLQDVRILPPGGVVNVQRAAAASAVYRSFASHPELWDREQSRELASARPRVWVDQLDELLTESVVSQLAADVPVGALCSGGLDSSLILAIAARHHPNLAIFHADVVGPLSESDAARDLARHLGLELQTTEVRDDDFIDLLPDTIEHFGHPFTHVPHSVPFLRVARLVRESGVKAVLSGEGADECFLGYSWLAPTSGKSLRRRYRPLPIPVASPDGEIVRSRYWGPPIIGGAQIETRSDGLAALYDRFSVASEAAATRQQLLAAGVDPAAWIGVVKSLDLLHYNLRSLLHRNDAIGMAASVESRFPFLHRPLVSYAVNLPERARMRLAPAALDREHPFFVDKWVLRKVADRYLPRSLSRRRKKPFPVNAYARSRLVVDPEYFSHSAAAELFEIRESDLRRFIGSLEHDLLVRLVQLEIWIRLYLRGDSMESVRRHVRQGLSVRS
ncbi:MAG TPA: asparagine synthase (glutamine-hydrolyzing) [Gemmatimonadales bacterium]|nr:asparagine synthase (glutamine-hydrolyzing) [Gemmatimonadales bacterium]